MLVVARGHSVVAPSAGRAARRLGCVHPLWGTKGCAGPRTPISSRRRKGRRRAVQCAVCAGVSAGSGRGLEAFAWRCRAAWPCTLPCRKDFSVCPQGWTHEGDGLCVAPAEYSGGCSSATDFAALPLQERAHWAAVCNAPWPCISL
mmetsp:Transcript_61264/g.189853  ORF Transcript_61264/g.189853 Transcript_61264/m.189853 type:complete len:146 (-) Transcript_61264:135-572(-)